MKKIFLLIMILFAIASIAHCQSETFIDNEIEIEGIEYLYPLYNPDYFEGYDKDTISCKYYSTENILQMVNFSDYSGADTSKVIDLKKYKQILYQLEKSEVINNTFTDSLKPYTSFLKKIDSSFLINDPQKDVSEYNVQISFSIFSITIHFPSFFGEGTEITYRDFTSSPLKSNIFRGNNITFTFTANNFLVYLQGEYLTEISVDLGDGVGYRNINYSSSSSYRKDITVSYSTIGEKNIKTRYKVNGQYYYSYSKINVVSLTIPDPDKTISLTSNISYNNTYAQGKIYIYHSELSDNQIKNPIIFVEGFDLFNNMNADELYHALRSENLDVALKERGYDIVIVNFKNARDYIQKNAFFLNRVISYINENKITDNELIIIGASMGGLVSRYALDYMEYSGYDHKTRLYISFDSPQKGANIPLGIQYWLNFFASASSEAEELYGYLCDPAAMQMLKWHIISDMSAFYSQFGTILTDTPTPLKNALNSELLGMGNYPEQLRKIAISNGSATASGLNYGAGDNIIYYHDNDPSIWGCTLIRGDVYATDPDNRIMIFDGRINVGGQALLLGGKASQVSRKSPMHLDYIPGGKRYTQKDFEDNDDSGKLIATHEDHCFIPTISSLAIDSEDPYYNIKANIEKIYESRRTPFDSLYYPENNENINQEHCAISNEMKDWLLNELLPDDIVLEDESEWSEGEIAATNSIRLLPGYKIDPIKNIESNPNPVCTRVYIKNK